MINNTYIYVVPQAPIAIPVDAIKYLGTIGPNKTSRTTFILKYNPYGYGYSPYSYTPMTLRYQTLPLGIAVIYRDVMGNQKVFNTTVAILVEPFVEVRLGPDTKAIYRAGELIITGTVINYGLATAHSVSVETLINGSKYSTFIGDIDPASQSAFRLLASVSKPLSRVEVMVTYKDEYGAIHTRSYVLPVKVEVITRTITTTTPMTFLGIPLEYTVVIVMVGIFLTAVFIAVYMFLRKRSKALEVGGT